MELLKQQYNLIKSSREVVLNYCSTIKHEDLTKKNENFNKASMMYLLVHIANTYLFWLRSFAAGEQFEYFKEAGVKDVEGLKAAFEEVNKTVENFLDKYDDPGIQIEGEIFWLKKNMTYTVLELFTHVITHEFHHKGQIMSMSRMLGYTPPDADVIRY
jgi:uncharacterized damage-inducible protein DinB